MNPKDAPPVVDDQMPALTPEEHDALLALYAGDFTFFAPKILKVLSMEGKIAPFEFNRPQQILHQIVSHIEKSGRLVRLVALKARRMGFSTYFSGRYYHKTSWNFNRLAVQVTHEPEATDVLFKMVKRFYNFTPKWLRPETRYNNTKLLEFNNKEGKGLGSGFRVATAEKEDFGSGQLIHYFHASEISKWPPESTESLLDAILQCVPDDLGTEVVFESTAKGVGGAFYDQFWNARYRVWVKRLDKNGDPVIEETVNESADENNIFTSVFLPWFVFEKYRMPVPKDFELTREEIELKKTYGIDDEQIYWRRFTLANKCRGRIETFWQEYPACLTAEMRVSTEHGIIPISQAGSSACTESGPIERWGVQPSSQIYKLTTKAGRVLRGTHDHPIQAGGGLVWLSRLKPGMKGELRQPMFAKAPYVERWGGVFGLESKITITPETARWIGYFMGDGSWYNGTIDFALDAKDEDVVEDAAGLTEALFGRRPASRTIARVQGRKGCVNLRLGCQEARPLLARLGLIWSIKGRSWRRNVCVPECIFQSPKEVVREFLRGLFEADGSARCGKVTWASSKLQFARDVQLLLLGFGFNVKMYPNVKKAGSGHEYTSWVLDFCRYDSVRFHDEIGFVSSRKRGLRKPLSDSGRPALPTLMVDEVETVVEDGIEQTYDFTMGTEDHLFMAQGIVTHNTPHEAFVASGRPVFDNIKLLKLKEAATPPIARYECLIGLQQFISKDDGRLRVWEEPKPGQAYIVSADVAEGLTEGDFSSADVINHRTGDQVAQWHGKIDPDEYGVLLMALGRRYNEATLGVERNNHGLTVVTVLVNEGYPNVYAEMVPEPPGKPRKRFGWVTNSATRPLIIDNLVKEVREDCHGIRCAETLEEMMGFKIQNNGKMEADRGWHDDRVMSMAIGKHLRQALPLPSMGLPAHIKGGKKRRRRKPPTKGWT